MRALCLRKQASEGGCISGLRQTAALQYRLQALARGLVLMGCLRLRTLSCRARRDVYFMGYWRLCVLCHSSGLSATHYSCLKGGHQAKLHTRSVLPGLSHVCVGPPWTDSHLLPGATLFTHDKHQNNDGLKFQKEVPSLGICCKSTGGC